MRRITATGLAAAILLGGGPAGAARAEVLACAPDANLRRARDRGE